MGYSDLEFEPAPLARSRGRRPMEPRVCLVRRGSGSFVCAPSVKVREMLEALDGYSLSVSGRVLCLDGSGSDRRAVQSISISLDLWERLGKPKGGASYHVEGGDGCVYIDFGRKVS